MTTASPTFQDTPIDTKIRLSALWVATMFVYAYVDIFNLMRADFLEGLLDGVIINTPLKVNQAFLVFAVAYILPASLMVYLSLTLSPRANRKANLIVAGVYAITVALACIGEEGIYFLFGSAVELVLFFVIGRTAWQWPLADGAPADGTASSRNLELTVESRSARTTSPRHPLKPGSSND